MTMAASCTGVGADGGQLDSTEASHPGIACIVVEMGFQQVSLSPKF